MGIIQFKRQIKAIATLTIWMVMGAVNPVSAQKIIPLYQGAAPGSASWNWKKKEYFSNLFNTQLVYNIVNPTLSVFYPDSLPANGTAVIICPGGAFRVLAINKEGYDVAKWLTKRGITCFVLQYRLVHVVSNDPAKEIADGIDEKKFNSENDSLIPLAVADAASALVYVRTHAAEFGISTKKIGIMGFSAGGIVTGASAFNDGALNRPNFIGCIYAPIPSFQQNASVPKNAPPLFLAAAGDDGEHIIPGVISFYNKWQLAGIPAELHLYEKGGHGFGMTIQHVTSDNWIVHFSDWLKQEGF